MSDRVMLGDYADIITGYPFKSSSYTENPDGIRLLRGDNIGQGRIRWDGVKRWPVNESSDHKSYQLKMGDIILAMDRPWIEAGLKYAEIRQEDTPSLLVQRTARLRARAGLDQRFLAYLIGSPRFTDHVLAIQTGTAVPHISSSQIEQFTFELPSISVQIAIGNVLGVLDDKITVNDRIARSARNLSRAYFHAAATEEDAEVVQLGSITQFLGRGITPRYTGDDKQLRILNQKCIRDGRVNLGPSRRTTASPMPEVKMLKPNDVLVNSTGVGTLGRVARWTRSEPCTVDSHVSILRFDPARTDPVCAAFGMLEVQPEIEGLGQGSTGQTELSRNQLAAIILTLPSRDKVIELRPKIDALEGSADAALEESLTLAELRDTLLPKLMSGKMQVRDAEKIAGETT